VLTVLGIILSLVVAAFVALLPFFVAMFVGEQFLKRLPFLAAKYPLLMLRNLRRNLRRTSLTFLATFVLVLIITMVWSVLAAIDMWTAEKTRDPKVIVTEKWQADSHMPYRYARDLCEGAANPRRAEDVRPGDSMTWQIYVGTVDPVKKTRDSFVFFIGLEPAKILTMMNEIWDELIPPEARRSGQVDAAQEQELRAAIDKMIEDPRACVIGRHRLAALHKQVGDRFKVTGINYQDIDLEFEVVGALPAGARYDDNAFMNRDYLNRALDDYARTHKTKHPNADRTLDIVWLKAPSQKAYGRLAQQIETSSLFRDPEVKCSTLSSEISAVMDSYRSLIWGMRWLLSPALLASMTVIIGTGISLSVRERRPEIAVLKILGYRPMQVLFLVLGEAILIGAMSGLVSVGLTFLAVNYGLARVNQTLIFIPAAALWWGPLVGGLSALIGSVMPAWSACRVKVTEVFARVA